MTMLGRSVAVALALAALAALASAELSPREEEFAAVPSGAAARESLLYITSEAHVAGTTGDAKMAEYVQSEFVKAGIPDAEIFALTVGLNYPGEAAPSLALVDAASGETVFAAALSEDVVASDRTSDTWYRNHTFNGYGPSGDVSGEAVYANYGRPEDFDALAAAGVDVKGKVVVTRYGQCFRGLKAMNAEARGAIATLIYSDPGDDGYGQGEVYPDGPWRPASAVQRGSAQFLSLCAGDPFRADARYAALPGFNETNATETLCGYAPEETIPRRPVLPISYGDAAPILARLGGAAAPEGFTGGIANLTYTVGPSEGLLLRVVTDNPFVTTPIWNVVGTIEGRDDGATPVLMGNHRDAWVFGAADPNSGTASLLEVAKGLGQLRKTGWKPRRTIKLLSWSGEEYGLLGSTGWAELNAQALANAVAYLNVDVAVAGDNLEVSATPALATLWEEVLDDLNVLTKKRQGEEDEEAKKRQPPHVAASALGVKVGNGPRGEVTDANSNRVFRAAAGNASSDVGTLGSGSDYTAFLDHLGIASMDFSFNQAIGTYGVYHSIYDSFDWIDNWGGTLGSPGSSFDFMAAAARVWGVLALRLADEPLVPFDHAAQAEALAGYEADVRSHEDPASGLTLDLSSLSAAVAQYKAAADQMAADVAAFRNSRRSREGGSNNEKEQGDGPEAAALNQRLTLTERRFLAEEGLPQRPYFKHTLQAPGLYLGYAAEALPGVRQALDDGDQALAQEQVEVAAARIAAAATFLATGQDE